MVLALHSLFLYSDTPPPCHPPAQLAQAIFEPNLYLYKYPSNLISQLFLLLTPPMKTKQTNRMFRNVGI